MDIFIDIFNEFSNIILLTLCILLILSWIVFLASIGKINKKLRKYQELTKYTNGTNIEEILSEYGKKIHILNTSVEQLDKELKSTVQKIKQHPQYYSIVRFNAFGNTGSDLSFAIALLDENFDGFVMSSIYGREESRTYAKPVEKGLSSYHLTIEEESAISIAKQKKV